MWTRRYYQPLLIGTTPRRKEISERSIFQLDLGRLAFLVGLVTSSFDIFLTTRIGGFTLRPYQVFLAPAFAYVLGQGFFDKRLRLPLGGAALLIWMVVIFAFIPHTNLISRSAGYALWLLLDVIVVFVAVQLFGDKKWAPVLLKWYLASFLGMSIVGLTQLA